MKTSSVFYSLLFFFFFPLLLSATIIIPPSDIGQLTYNADVVVYGKIVSHLEGDPYQNKLEVINLIRGDIGLQESIIVDEYSSRLGNLTNTVAGDVDFAMGEKYLLFLSLKSNGHYQSRLLSLSTFREGQMDGQAVFMHDATLLDLKVIENGADMNGLKGVYKVSSFINHLEAITKTNIGWDEEIAGRVFPKYSSSVNESPAEQANTRFECGTTVPAHCTVLIGDVNQLDGNCNNLASPAKYESNVFDVCVAGGASSDPSKANAITLLQDAVTAMDGMPGVSITYSGIDATAFNPVPCADDVADDRSAFGGSNNKIWVFFNDPCEDIADLDLMTCEGVLGVGGHYAYDATCHTDICGDQWRNALWPYFIMNNGAGCVSDYSYTAVLIHEMLHSIGVGHIAGACTAIMNEEVCNSNEDPPTAPDYGITSLDTDCTDWMYNMTVATPIELLSFNANLVRNEVLIQWATASELDNDFFTIERSTKNIDWKVIGNVQGAGNSLKIQDYSLIDNNPLSGESYYRLKQTDFSGNFSYSHISTIRIESEQQIKIQPNPVNSTQLAFSYNVGKNKSALVKIFNINGQLLKSASFNLTRGWNDLSIEIGSLSQGVYFLETITEEGEQITERFSLIH